MKILLILFAFVFISLTFGCHDRKENNIEDMEDIQKSESQTRVQLSPAQEAATGVICGVFVKQPLENLVKAPGFIDSPPQYKATINPYLTVYVEKIHFIVGDPVKKGQVVITASSPEYVSLQQEYLETINRLTALEKDFTRKQDLQQDNITSKKEFEAAESAFNSELAKKSALQNNLHLMGTNIKNLDEGNIQSKIFMRSPISGKISSLSTAVGQHTAPHEVMMEINNVEHLHVEIKVFEPDIPKIREGQKVVFTLPDFEEQVFKGHIYRISNTIDAKGRFTQVHAHLDNENEAFLPGMYINSHIVVEEDSVWSVPSSAIVREGNEEFLFVLQEINEEGKVYLRKKVLTGVESMGFTAIKNLDPVSLKDSVVTQGAYYLANALNEAGGHDQ
ncbi:MAG: efflux RND transporter periplasmic adaptor subunit [Cyclobacteriaceae bacterium]